MEDWICIIHLNFYKTVRRFITGIRQKNRQIQVILIQAALVVAAVSTLIQLFPIGKKFPIGSGLPMIMGVSFAYVLMIS